MKASLRSIAALVAVTLAVLGSTNSLPIETKELEGTIWGTSPPVECPRKTYVLVGTDSFSNAYDGDTSTAEANGLLCIHMQGLPAPSGLIPAQYTTNGGALRNSWSGGKLFVVPQVEGMYLSTPEIADDICATYGALNFYVGGARMAEFHDGDTQAGWTGWAFWSQALLLPMNGRHTFDGRLWVKINDQESNPWSGGGEERLALTFKLVAQLDLCEPEYMFAVPE